MTHWQFRTLNPNDTSGTSTSEDNFAQEERTSVDILVRECIQNPLDAKANSEKVKVHFRWVTLARPASTFLADLLTNEFRTQLTHAKVLPNEQFPPDVRFLIIEDSGTIGLRGTYENSAVEGDEENWNAFWFREGEGAKPSKANGGAGQGKLTMYVASKIRTVVALTTRAADGKRLLFGSCRFRRNYPIGGERYAREARWGSTSDLEVLAQPIENSTILDQYENELQIQRGNKPGTTFLIPMPDAEITPEAITTAVINEFYFPILRGRLTVCVDDQEISKDTIAEQARALGDKLRFPAPFRDFLNEIANQHLEATPVARFEDKWAGEPKLSKDHFIGAHLETTQAEFQAGNLISAEFPIRVSSISNGPMTGKLRVFIQAAEGPNDTHESFVRQDLAVDKEKSLRAAKRLLPARALILIDDEVLSKFLAAAEEPTHREWNGSRPKLTLSYRNAALTLRLVRHAASRLLELLAPPATKDSLALASFFPDLAVQRSSVKNQKPKKKDAKDGGDKGTVDAPPPTPRKLELMAQDDGALVRVNQALASENTSYPFSCKLELAYATEFGKPFDQWDAADFFLSKASHAITSDKVDDIVPYENGISFSISGLDAWLAVTGFDENRQLEMRLKYTENSDANDI